MRATSRGGIVERQLRPRHGTTHSPVPVRVIEYDADRTDAALGTTVSRRRTPITDPEKCAGGAGSIVLHDKKPRTFTNANRDWKAAMKRAGRAAVGNYARSLGLDISHPKIQTQVPALTKPFTPTRCYDLVHSWSTQTNADPRHAAAIARPLHRCRPSRLLSSRSPWQSTVAGRRK